MTEYLVFVKMHTSSDYKDGRYIPAKTYLVDASLTTLEEFFELSDMLPKYKANFDGYSLNLEVDNVASNVVKQVCKRFSPEGER